MEDAFGTLIWVVAIVGALIAVYTLVGTGRGYRRIGGGGIGRGENAHEDTPQERAEDIRQMVDARNALRAQHGAAPVDLEADLAGLDAPPPRAEAPVSPELRDEIREHVIARNARRVRAGAEPLDVEAEIERRIRDLS
jgi:hypothetical protein